MQTASLELRPGIDVRPHEGSLGGPSHEDYRFSVVSNGYELSVASGFPAASSSPGWAMKRHSNSRSNFLVSCGTASSKAEVTTGRAISGAPAASRSVLSEGRTASLVASTEDWDHINALDPTEAFAAEAERRRRLLRTAPEEARSGIAAELVLAADQFLITPVGRTRDSVQAHSIGDEVRTVIAGYHWFTDWGRDTMISLEGLTLTTGSTLEAQYILRSFRQVRTQWTDP